ncbi:MAG: orotidine-5'-phosphate decarboxylase [Cyanobacteria bacterium J06638_28]
MSKQILAPADRIIVPLDVPSEAAARRLIRQISQVAFWKVGLELFVSAGPAILEFLKAENKRVFLDLKFHDIPNTMAGACRVAGRYGVDLLTVHASAGPDALKAALTAAQEGASAADQRVPSLIAVTVLTSLTTRSLAVDLKIPLELSDYALQMALLAQQSGLAGSVCSPHEAALLRRCCGLDWLLVCPGVRPAGSQKGDQQRVLTPEQAVNAGANYLVIGRPITQANDPAAAFAAIADSLAVAKAT